MDCACERGGFADPGRGRGDCQYPRPPAGKTQLEVWEAALSLHRVRYETEILPESEPEKLTPARKAVGHRGGETLTNRGKVVLEISYPGVLLKAPTWIAVIFMKYANCCEVGADVAHRRSTPPAALSVAATCKGIVRLVEAATESLLLSYSPLVTFN